MPPTDLPAPHDRKPADRSGALLRLALGLALTPSLVGLATVLVPGIRLSELPASVAAFAGATLVPIFALAISAKARVPLRATLAVLTAAATTLVIVALSRPRPIPAMLLVDTALVALAWAIGAAIGQRIQHAAHLLPACIVAASADIVSTLSPEGPTHAIAGSDRALSIAAVWFPVPGTHAVSPALGAGDLLFMALLFGAAAVHGLPYARTVLLAALGTALAGLAAAWLGVAVPALVPIAAAVVLGLPAVRRLRPVDRSAARWSMVIASALVLAVLTRKFLVR